MPDLVGGGAGCGPVNPMQQLGKRFGQDRGVQFDSMRPAGADGVPGAPAFRTARGGGVHDEAAFLRGEGSSAFHVDQMRQALPSALPAGAASAWAPPRAGPALAGPSAGAAPAWAQDFLQSGQKGKARSVPPSAVSAAPAPAVGRAAPIGAFPRFHGMARQPLGGVSAAVAPARAVAAPTAAARADMAHVSGTWAG